MRCRRTSAVSLLAIAALALTAGCAGHRSTSDKGPSRALPGLTGVPLATARDTAGVAGFRNVTTHDATGAGRAQSADTDWKVCFQQPASGTARTGTRVDLAVVQSAETCPATDAAPPASPTPTSTRTSSATHRSTVHHTTTRHGSSSRRRH